MRRDIDGERDTNEGGEGEKVL
jgi:hypothetical protein